MGISKLSEEGPMSGHVIHTADGKLVEDTSADYVCQMVNQAVQQGNVDLHIHGGFVSESAGKEIARRLTPQYQQAGVYPIFHV